MSQELLTTKRSCRFFDDFYDCDTTATTGKWIKNGVNTEVVGIADADCGVVSMATGGADNDTCELQSQGECYALAANKKYTFECVFRATTANATKNLLEWFHGLMVHDTTILGTGVDSSTDYVGLQKDVGDSNIDLVIRASTGTIDRVAAIATFPDATYIKIRVEIEVSASAGTGIVRVFVNDAPVVLSGGSYEYSTTSLPSTELSVTHAIGAGSGDVCTMLVDYVEAIGPRSTY